MAAPSSMWSLAIFLVMGKCTCAIVSDTEIVNRHLSNRLCKLYACYVSRMPSIWCVTVSLTISAFRLNSRDYVRNRFTTDRPDNAFGLSSIRIDAPREAHGAKSRQSGVSVTVHRSTASEFALRKSDNNVAPISIVPNLVRYLHLLAIDTHFG